MKSTQYAAFLTATGRRMPVLLPRGPIPQRTLSLAVALGLRQMLLTLALILPLIASCSSLGKPERQLSPVAPACNQRAPARDSGDPPSGADASDWTAWARAYVAAQWAVVDRDNKRAATADCLDDLARIKP